MLCICLKLLRACFLAYTQCKQNKLKGTVSRVLCFWFFSWISFPQAPDYTSRAVLNFFENSRRYLQLKVSHRCRWHRWQMAKIFKLKNFNYFVWIPLGSRVNIYIDFCLQVKFQISAAWYCTHYLPLVSLTPVANLLPVQLIPVAICHWRRWHRWQICRRYRWHRWQICHRSNNAIENDDDERTFY